MDTADPNPSQVPPERCASNRCRRAERSGGLHRRRPAPGSLLCASCRRTLAADLAALPELYRQSEQQFVLPARHGGPARVTGHRPEAPPVSDAALDARHDAVVQLASCARFVRDEAASEEALPARTVAELAAYLGRHLGTLAAHPAAGTAADEVARVAAALRMVVAPPKPELVPLGRCVEPGCDAEVSLPARGGDDMVLRGPLCGAGHVLTPRQWLLLNRTRT
ncbi:hypothetical protein [Streptomyces sp. WMMC940]|uniref:hypothetical protein n=1 Tax=Streptomyces sp. WMMC940 TaxID=3015153 RepID=UPI0022B5E622|nr:hypothetical protein [Streptomyces sp. WMMC940]MCZ7458937.1 hypothetical protein [Streptomyces sp. WMMC940]